MRGALEELIERLQERFATYRDTLSDDRRAILDRYRLVYNARYEEQLRSYEITADGEEELIEWLRQPPVTFEMREEGLLKLFFADALPRAEAVEILRAARVPFALFHCTSMYPTPYSKVRLGGLADLKAAFPDAVLGLSDHSLGNYTCFAAVPLGASLLEKHFTSDMSWPGPDVPISMDPAALADLVAGSRAIHEALGGGKTILPEEQPTIDFAYACVVTTRDVAAGELMGRDNLWVKRPGTGEIKAVHYEEVLGR